MFGKKTEITVGAFMIVGIIILVYLAISLGNIDLFGSKNYKVTALFNSITGLKSGAKVEVAGVQVGKVAGITLDDDMALVTMSIFNDIKITDDSIVSIRTKGMIGEKYIKLSPGGSDEYVENGGVIMDTEDSISIEELISKYMFEQ